MRRAIRVVGLGLVLLFIGSAAVFTRAAGDGIPDNCEYQNAPNYRPNLFPRYEPQNSRLVLVDWATGADTTVLQTDLATDAFWIIGWSPDCRYLAAAVGETRDYYVWDTVAGRQIGSIPHARHINWSPDVAYALVQSDAGAYLWSLSTSTPLLLTTVFDDVTNRNFNNFGWDMEGGYISAALADGRDFRYDLRTGQELPVPVPTYQYDESRLHTITLDGKTYSCLGSYSYYFSVANVPPYAIVLDYDRDGHRLVLVSNRTPVRVVMENVTAPRFVRKDWSTNCRYFAFALGDDRVTDTYMWDAVNNKLVGVFEGAQLITHPITWDPTGDYVVIQTRLGGFLWNLSTNTRTLLHDGVVTDSGRWTESTIRNFFYFSWDVPRGQLLAVPVAADNTLEVFDMYTGQRQTVYDLGGRPGPVSYTEIDGTDWLILATSAWNARAGGMALWNRATNTGYQLPYMGSVSWWKGVGNVAFSPDNRYFVYHQRYRLNVWDLQNLNPDGSPNYRHPITENWSYFHFVDATTIDFGSGLSRWDVVTGERIGTSPLVLPEGGAPVITASLVNSPGAFWVPTKGCGIVDGINRRMPHLNANGRFRLLDWKTGEEAVLLETDVDYASATGWSPDCHYLVGYVRNRAGSNTIIWDANTGQRVHTLPVVGGPRWSPNNDQIIFTQGWNAKLFNMQSGQFVELAYLGYPNFREVYWDYGRNQILVSGVGGVISYDMTSGALRQVYTRPEDSETRFALSDDRTLLAAYTDNSSPGFQYDGLTIWNLNSLDNFQVNVQGWVGDVRISPDNHYLVVRGTVLRVWDLTNLPSEYDARLPMYRLPIGAGMKWAFEDSNTIAISTFRGEIVQHWDLRSGQQIEAS